MWENVTQLFVRVPCFSSCSGHRSIEIWKECWHGAAAVVAGWMCPRRCYSRWCSAKVVRVHASKRMKKLSTEEGRILYEKLDISKSS